MRRWAIRMSSVCERHSEHCADCKRRYRTMPRTTFAGVKLLTTVENANTARS
jgi:hypothetical protein